MRELATYSTPRRLKYQTQEASANEDLKKKIEKDAGDNSMEPLYTKLVSFDNRESDKKITLEAGDIFPEDFFAKKFMILSADQALGPSRPR